MRPRAARGAGQPGRTLLLLSLATSLAWPAGYPKQADGGLAATRPEQAAAPTDGLISNAVPCLAINDANLPGPSGSVQLTWSGQAQQGRLVLQVAGTEAAQPVWVNGQLAGTVPALPEGEACGPGETVYLDFASAVLVQGQNTVLLGDGGRPGDAWTAANVRLEVFGEVEPVAAPSTASPSGLSATTAITSVVTFANAYDGTNQQAVVQRPDGYTGATPVPLVIYLHGRGASMEEGLNVLAAAANARGWLLAAPQMHGRWPTPPTPPGAYAYGSVESQYDAVGTLRYLLTNSPYNVDTNRVYLVGYSMGEMTAVITAAKWPHLFAAVFDNKGPTDMVQWYAEQSALRGSNSTQVKAMRQECYTGSAANPTLQAPAGNPFCYQRRSSLNFASNLLHDPISITHSQDDVEVPLAHSLRLRDAINGFGPDRAASVYIDTTVGPTCPPYFHCYEPDQAAVLNFLAAFTLDNVPEHINIRSDQSKAFYWLNLAQSGGDHWSQVEANAFRATKTVTLAISDTHQLTLGLNLGSAPTVGLEGLSQPGLGLGPGKYRVRGAGLDRLVDYVSGYLAFTVSSGQSTVTVTGEAYPVYLPLVLR